MKNSFLIILIPLFFISCASTVRMYTGNALPQNQVAIIINKGRGTVQSVDGKRAAEGRATLPGKLEILPGKHTLRLAYYYHSSLPMGVELADVKYYKFDFKPGKKYVVKYSLNEKGVRPKNAKKSNTGLSKSSSSLVYVKTWKSKPIWLWIEELQDEKK